MLSDYSNSIVLVTMILASDLCLGYAAYLAGRRRVLRQVELAPPAEPTEPMDAGADLVVESPELMQEFAHLESRLSEMHQTLKRLTDDTSSRPPGTAPQADGVLDFAARLAQRGFGVEELVDLCNLGRSEAELVHALHSNRPAAVA